MTTLHKDMPGFICCACSLYRFFLLVLSSPWDSDKRNINLFVCHVHVEKLTNKTELSWTEKRGGNDLLFLCSWNVCFSVWKFILQYFFMLWTFFLAPRFCKFAYFPHQLFEGLKVSRGDDGRLRFFRPMLNMKRMSKSAKRACLPVRWRDGKQKETWKERKKQTLFDLETVASASPLCFPPSL